MLLARMWLPGGVTELVIKNLKILTQSMFSSPMMLATYHLFSSRILIGFELDSRSIFIFANFSSPNFYLRKSLNRIDLFGERGALVGLNMVSAKLNVFGFTLEVGMFVLLEVELGSLCSVSATLWFCVCCYY